MRQVGVVLAILPSHDGGASVVCCESTLNINLCHGYWNIYKLYLWQKVYVY